MIGATESKKRKVLIVSFHFAPANTSGAVRIGKFAKYLPEFGWEPVVLTADTIKTQPQTLPLEIDEAKVVRTPYHDLITPLQRKQPNYSIFTAYTVVPLWKRVIDSWRKPLRIIQELPLVRVLLSPSIGWYPQAVNKGLEVISQSNVELIFSSSPPPTSHLIVSRLQRKTRLPWVAEFRCCITCVYHKPYPPTMRSNQPVFFRFLCSLSIDSQKEVVRPEEVCGCWKGVTLGIE